MNTIYVLVTCLGKTGGIIVVTCVVYQESLYILSIRCMSVCSFYLAEYASATPLNGVVKVHKHEWRNEKGLDL